MRVKVGVRVEVRGNWGCGWNKGWGKGKDSMDVWDFSCLDFVVFCL